MLLNVVNIHKSFADEIVLEGVNLRIERREKVVLVGRNGSGKTTLLRLLTGMYEPDGGSYHLAAGAKIGYLRQEEQVERGHTVLQEVEQARGQELEVKQRLEHLEKRLESNPTDEELEEYSTLHERFIEMEGYSAERDVKIVLQRMGFTEEEFDKPTSALSGGERTRLALARLLLEEPDLLILDEPTNHLDLQATEWLEGWLRSYPGAVLIVSHDRIFLERLGDRIVELVGGTLKSYPGPFDKYLQLRAEEEERQAEVARRQAQEIAKLDEYVRRFMNSQRTAQARGRLKMKEKLVASQVDAPKSQKSMAAGFKPTSRSGDLVLEAKKLTMGFDGMNLFENADWTVRSGDRWGVVGENGAGKSTLLKVILGRLQAISGSARVGSNVVLGYFAQDVVDLDPDQTALDYLVYEFDMLPADARTLLGRFLFSGDDVFRPIRTFSGGEKNKLVLASLTVLNPNLLVLDEPTNHLDMDSREALAEVLKEYTGTLVLISHDRWLLEQVTTHTLDVKRSGLVEYPGSYREYRNRSSKPADTKGQKTKIQVVETKPELSPRELSKEIQRVTKLVADLEEEIAASESSIQEIEAKLSNPEGLDILKLTEEYGQVKTGLETLIEEWAKQSENVQNLRSLQGK